ncbi:hypothetical protein EZS27_017579 [termite gut metagenome]|uniref:Uncharacterized protein n=1 Tax=termite gut metagenome TaxID=433724 RepID=A0A5J4RKJ0_9ZZZZ
MKRSYCYEQYSSISNFLYSFQFELSNIKNLARFLQGQATRLLKYSISILSVIFLKTH